MSRFLISVCPPARGPVSAGPVRAVLALLLAAAAVWPCASRAQASHSAADAQLSAALGGGRDAAGLAPLVVPGATRGLVLPERIALWRDEARALERGDGELPRDPARAATLYCQAARHGDAQAQFALGWMLVNGHGVERDEVQAAHLFAAAAEQGLEQARGMADRMGAPRGDTPPCLKPALPELPPPVRPAAPQLPPQMRGLAPGTWVMVNGKPMQVPTAVAAATDRARPAALAQGAPGQLPMPDGPLPGHAPPAIVEFVRLVAPEYRLSPQLVLAIMATESGFRAGAISPKNAQGLMQLIPETAARFGVRNPLDPAQNIRGGMAYLRWLLARFEGDVALAAAAYNAGEGAVERYLGVPPYAETLAYVAKVLPAVGVLRHPFDPKAGPPSERLALMRQPIRVR
ncbi:MAG: hypothetical protein RIQ53_869 [Pseudomonadota bacterium]|jgi:TPR repeat protein